MRDEVALGVAAVATGVAVAIGVWIFKAMIGAAEWLGHGWHSDSWAAFPLPWVLIAPVLGGLLIGWILHLASEPEEPGHGVAEVIRAVTLGTDDFPERRTPLKAAVAALSLGAGASLGPEDPAVEIGGGIGHYVARKRALPEDAVQSLVAAGGAAGLAAAFQAPAAAVVFAVEVFALRPISRTTALVGAAVVPAYVVTRVLTPVVEPAVPSYGFGGGWELLLCLGLGLVGGALSAGHIWMTYTLEIAIIRWRALPRWLKPALGGLLLGLVGTFLPELLGTGYETGEAILRGQAFPWTFLLALAIGKAVLMTVSFGSGFLGGFFAPALFVGAALGTAYGTMAAALLPGLDLAVPLFAAAGMAAVLAGNVRAPLAAVLLIATLSGSYAVAPLLLIAAGTGYWTSRTLEQHSLYTYGIVHPAVAERRGTGSEAGPQSDVRGGLDGSE